MNERKNNRQTEKDYYFGVMLTQLLCSVFLMCLFFFFTRGEGDQQITEKYSSLLREDFLTVELNGAVSNIKEYLLDESFSFAVNGSRVESVEDVTATEKESTTSDVETETVTSETTTEDEEMSDIAVQTISANVGQQTAPLKLAYKNKQNMVSPVEEGVYTSYFGDRTDPIAGGEDFHKGIDIAADDGSPIRSVYDGEITLTGEDEYSGKYVFVEHEDGIETLYCHCSEILADEGETVRQGDIIALVGSTGYSTGPHLHFEVRIKEESVNPLPLLENAD